MSTAWLYCIWMSCRASNWVCALTDLMEGDQMTRYTRMGVHGRFDKTQHRDKLKIREIMPRLPKEAQEWLNRVSEDEFGSAEGILNAVGEESYIQNWRFHKDRVDQFSWLFGTTVRPMRM